MGQIFRGYWSRPPLPADIEQVLRGPCPIWKGKKVIETHLLVLIPANVDWMPLTLKNLGVLVQKPKKSGSASKYEYLNLRTYQDMSEDHSYWMLMSRDVLEGSRSKDWKTQFQQVTTLAQTTGIQYVVPKVREVVICLFMRYVSTEERLYNDMPLTYTRCEEFDIELKQKPIVGGFGVNGFYAAYDWLNHENRGVGVARKFRAIGH